MLVEPLRALSLADPGFFRDLPVRQRVLNYSALARAKTTVDEAAEDS
jgi:hypothetical protein